MELRSISSASIPSALDRARHYRLLNDPANAESICRDVLAIDPTNQNAVRSLILALTDQFDGSASRIQDAKSWIDKLPAEYDRAYFMGLICERAAKTILAAHRPGCQYDAYDWFRNAMSHFDRAEQLSTDEQHDDPILRWNSCARLIEKHHLTARPDDSFQPYGD